MRCGSQLLAYSAGPGHISGDARCYSDHLADRCVRRSSSVRLGNESTRRGTSVDRPGVTCTSADSLSRSAARPTTNAPSGDEPTAPSAPANRTSTGHFRLLSLELQLCKFPFQEGSETCTHACPCVGRGRQNGRSGGLASRRVEWLPSATKVNGPCPSPRAATSGTAPNAGSVGGDPVATCRPLSRRVVPTCESRAPARRATVGVYWLACRLSPSCSPVEPASGGRCLQPCGCAAVRSAATVTLLAPPLSFS